MNIRSRLPKSMPLHYHLSPHSCAHHEFVVELTVVQPDPRGQMLALPVWIPGSYLVREFARHIVAIAAHDMQGPLPLIKQDKARWQAAPVRQGVLTVRYTVYAFELSVRGAYLDTTRGFFNGTSVFLAVEGQETQPHRVTLDPAGSAGNASRGGDASVSPSSAWRVATTLPAVSVDAQGWGEYCAENYDALIDHPVEMGHLLEWHFEAAGVPHRFVHAGLSSGVDMPAPLDEPRFLHDVSRICAAQIALFGEAPFREYLFLSMVTDEGYGGLEHRTSTALLTHRAALPRRLVGKQGNTHAAREVSGSSIPGMPPVRAPLPTAYRDYLGLISHEYFHSWNVKRIKPAAFAPYDVQRENYTRLLWAFEGITSYYDDLMLARAGVIGEEHYLELLAQTATAVLRAPGHRVQTLEDASFDAWIKYYRPDENSFNTQVSYYQKGALVALCLDLHIRAQTAGRPPAERRSLDHVMRALWQRFGQNFYRGPESHHSADSRNRTMCGVGEREWESVAAEVCGLDLRPQFDAWLRSTVMLPLAELLATVGVRWQTRAALSARDKGGWLDMPGGPAVWLGARTREERGFVKLTHVDHDGPAAQAGLAAGDLLIALDGLKANADQLDALLAQAVPGQVCEVLAFRREVLHTCHVSLVPAPHSTVGLKIDAENIAGSEMRRCWLQAK